MKVVVQKQYEIPITLGSVYEINVGILYILGYDTNHSNYILTNLKTGISITVGNLSKVKEYFKERNVKLKDKAILYADGHDTDE